MLLVFGPRSTDYDFGPGHPLTPRRFGPGIHLLRAVGAVPGLAPEPALDDELRWLHTRPYVEAVKRLSSDPGGPADAGIGEGGDDPPFAGMHEAGAMVAGGSIRAIEAILRGDVEHALHPGGGLHHAMAGRASGFCIYNDPALAIARARREGLRVMYIDLDVHHGDGVQALHWDDPGVLTFSIHESGRTLFPGTGGASEVGEGRAAGTSINVPLPAGTGEGAWLAALRLILPELAATFGPDIIVSQHGADSHTWDPLAHLEVTTTAMGEAARLVDELAHRHARGRWLATGGGGYDVYRVVPRTWALTWLAGAHREVPTATPIEWRERWSAEAARYGQAPLPVQFTDAPNAGRPMDSAAQAVERRALSVAALVRRVVVPRLVREATDRGWWPASTLHPASGPAAPPTVALPTAASPAPAPAAPTAAVPTAAPHIAAVPAVPPGPRTDPIILVSVDAATWSRLSLAPRVVAPADPAVGHAILLAAIRDGATVVAAVEGATIVGVVVVGPVDELVGVATLLAVGVVPEFRRRGLATRLLAALPEGGERHAEVTLAERDVMEPMDRRSRALIANRLLAGAGYEIEPAGASVRTIDPSALRAVRASDRAPSS